MGLLFKSISIFPARLYRDWPAEAICGDLHSLPPPWSELQPPIVLLLFPMRFTGLRNTPLVRTASPEKIRTRLKKKFVTRPYKPVRRDVLSVSFTTTWLIIATRHIQTCNPRTVRTHSPDWIGECSNIFLYSLWLTQRLIRYVPFKEQFKDLALTIIAREVKLVNSSKYSQLMFVVEVRRAVQCTNTAPQLLWTPTKDDLRQTSVWTIRSSHDRSRGKQRCDCWRVSYWTHAFQEPLFTLLNSYLEKCLRSIIRIGWVWVKERSWGTDQGAIGFRKNRTSHLPICWSYYLI